MNENYLNELEQLLSKNEDYLVEDTLNKNKVAELAHKYDGELIDLLASHKDMRKLFFVETKNNVLVFNKDRFIQFISNKAFLPDSYTTYKNKIGLATDIDLLAEQKKVVLDWPYKDCVLEGGQDKEDAKRNELFFNEVLAPDQIDRLLDEKVLTGFKRYDKDGEHEVKEISDDDNLIIRGNNLLALHSLKRRYAGKVKLVYIDPPYNTGSDSFGYNDKFNHSTWLTFMRNRLTAVKDLLNIDGSIFIQVDGNEGAYLKVLCDEIFGRDNFRSQITWLRSSSGKTISRNLSEDTDYILWYAKSSGYQFNPVYKPLSEATKKMYSKNDNDGRGDYRLYPLQKTGSPGPETTYDFVDNEGKTWPCPVKGWRMRKEKLKALENDDRLWKSGNSLAEKAYWNERTGDGQIANNLWEDIANLQGSNAEKIDFGGQKPEKLIQRIIEMTTSKGDLVLDYHLGSGTTASTAMKMGRHFIGVEQLDYGQHDAIHRLTRVMQGETNGVSKNTGWTGGGSFVYASLMDLGNKFVEKVKHATTDKELEGLLGEAQKSSFLSYKVDPEKINPGDKNFKDLSHAHKKQLLLEIVDRNHLYVNYSEIDDTDYGVSAEVKKLNKQFYGN